jgi:hypothetical protein
MKKRALFLILIIIMFSNSASAMLGLMPARTELDFEPNKEFSMDYAILSDKPDQDYHVFAVGDFAEYVTFDQTNFTGGGSFKATVKLPAEAKKYGDNTISIRVEEIPKGKGGISTRLIVGARIKINVPYPGKYAEIEFNCHDANEGENITFDLGVYSRGWEGISVQPVVNIISLPDGEFLKSIFFDATYLNTNEKANFQKNWNTAGVNPGEYNASVVVDYGGGKATTSKGFTIGTLKVKILNYTTRFPQGKLSRFNISVKSNWNDRLDVLADLNLKKDGKNVSTFRTPTITLANLGGGVLEGYFDATSLEVGVYQAEIILRYVKDHTTIEEGEIFIYKEANYTLYIIVGIIVVVLAIVIALIFILKRKNENKKIKKR